MECTLLDVLSSFSGFAMLLFHSPAATSLKWYKILYNFFLFFSAAPILNRTCGLCKDYISKLVSCHVSSGWKTSYLHFRCHHEHHRDHCSLELDSKGFRSLCCLHLGCSLGSWRCSLADTGKLKAFLGTDALKLFL